MYIKTLSTEEAGKVFGWAKSMPCSYNVLQLQNKSSCLTVQEWSCQALKCEFQVFARPVVQRSTCNCQVPQIRKVWSHSNMWTLVNQKFLLVQLLFIDTTVTGTMRGSLTLKTDLFQWDRPQIDSAWPWRTFWRKYVSYTNTDLKGP